MSPVLPLFGAIALLAAAPLATSAGAELAHAASPERPMARAAPVSALQQLREAVLPQTDEQVRIDQRLTIRIAPHLSRDPDLSRFDEEREPRFRERRMGKCVAVSGIAGVQIAPDDRLLLFMRDHRLVAATLDKACTARDFYSGFYLDRTSDGQLCVNRDELQSRTGAHCPVTRMRQLIQDD